ncbi:M23 family metallopeptidase [Williamsia sp. CHRR-6]|nr:M23 family metallopeptidase [Williamsia sp. CHRR-6]
MGRILGIPILLAAIGLTVTPPWAVGAPPIPGGYGWPLSPRPTVVRGFDPPAQRWLAGHRGVDLAPTGGLGTGSAVLAAGVGVVHFAGSVGGKSVVSVLHPDGLLTTYEPVRPAVVTGTPVTRGTVLGTVLGGHLGCVGTCLHWGARRGTGSAATYLDPLALLGVVRVRLKPLNEDDAG